MHKMKKESQGFRMIAFLLNVFVMKSNYGTLFKAFCRLENISCLHERPLKLKCVVIKSIHMIHIFYIRLKLFSR